MTNDPNGAGLGRRIGGEPLLIIGCTLAYCIGNIGGWLAPQILFGTMHDFKVPAATAGLLTLVEGVTTGLLSMAFGALQLRMSYRNLAVSGVVLAVAINALTPWAPSFGWLLATRFISGVASALLIYVAISLTAARSVNPDRAYAAMNIAANVYGAVILATLPLFAPLRLGLSYVPFAAIVAAICLPAMFFIPSRIAPERVAATITSAMEKAPARHVNVFVILFLAMIPLSFQSFTIFTFALDLGLRAGVSGAALTTVMGGAVLASVVGPFLAAATTRRFGRWVPFFVMAILMIASNFVLIHSHSLLIFAGGLIVDLTAAYFFVPVMLAWSATLDATGRSGSILIGGFAIVTSLSPSMAGAMVDRFGLDVLSTLVVVTGACIVGLLVLLRVVSAHLAEDSSAR